MLETAKSCVVGTKEAIAAAFERKRNPVSKPIATDKKPDLSNFLSHYDMSVIASNITYP